MENSLAFVQSDCFIRHDNFRLFVFSYLTGADLYHKIALLNKSIRMALPQSGLLDQIKILTMSTVPINHAYLKYAFELTNIVQLIAKKDSIEIVN